MSNLYHGYVSHNQRVIPLKTNMAIENLIVPYDK